MELKYKPQHKWYYYPHMPKDEVLAFKLLKIWKTNPKDRSQIPVHSCFHSSFDDPNMPVGSPPRTSTKYCVTIFVGGRRVENLQTTTTSIYKETRTTAIQNDKDTTAFFNRYFPSNFQKNEVTGMMTTGLVGWLTGNN